MRIGKTIITLSALLAGAFIGRAADLRLGIIGCDTSHVVAFANNLNNDQAKGHIPGARIVAAYKGGSPDVPASASRVEGFAKTLSEKNGVKFYDTIEELCAHVDAVLLESVDGRTHLEQVKPVLKAHKPVYIDKPMAGSLRDAREIFRLAAEAKTPVFSSSGLRFGSNTVAVHNGSIGKVISAETEGPLNIEPYMPDLFWYGVHGVEALYAVMGTGCQTVQRSTNAAGNIEVTGKWGEGRKGVYRQSSDKKFRGQAVGEKGRSAICDFQGYEPLLAQIIKFFQTGISPVEPANTLEALAFMEAADLSQERGGKEVRLSEVQN